MAKRVKASIRTSETAKVNIYVISRYNDIPNVRRYIVSYHKSLKVNSELSSHQ